MKPFNLHIISPGSVIFEGDAVSLVAPCTQGYLGVLADHAPLVAKIQPGKISFTKSNNEQINLNSSADGVLEVLKNNVSLILHKAI